MFQNRKEKNFKLKTLNRDRELKTSPAWIFGQGLPQSPNIHAVYLSNVVFVILLRVLRQLADYSQQVPVQLNRILWTSHTHLNDFQ